MAKTLNVRFQQKYDTAANWAKSTIKLLAGEMAIESDTGKFKFGDGEHVFADLAYAGADASQLEAIEDNYYHVVPVMLADEGRMESDGEALSRAVKNPKKGDIAVCERVIGTLTTASSLTAYMYNGSAWAALDGNYDAENVFTSQKITLAGNFTSVGNYSKGTEIAAGTSLQSILSGLFQATIQPTKTAPTATISVTGDDGGKEVGDTYTKPTATLTVTSGNYTNEGSATGVKYLANNVVVAYGADPDTAAFKVANTNELVNNGTVQIAASTYSSGATTASYTDNVASYTFSGKAHNEAGIVAKDNLGNASNPAVQIAAGDLTVDDKTASFRGYRKMFVGSTTATSLDSAAIRALNLKNEKASTTQFTVTAKEGATNLVIACPTKSVGKKYTLKEVLMFSAGVWDTYTGKFTDNTSTVSVDGKVTGADAQDYTVYMYKFAALKGDTQFKITLAAANA